MYHFMKYNITKNIQNNTIRDINSSIETFFNIIKNAKLWLLDIEKSNDYLECVACRKIVNEKIEDFLHDDKQGLEIWKSGMILEYKQIHQIEHSEFVFLKVGIS